MGLATQNALERSVFCKSSFVQRRDDPLAQNMHSVSALPIPTFHPDSGIELIARRSAALPVYMPEGDLHPADSADQPRLGQLFPLRSFEDFLWARLTPAFSSTSFLKPARFRENLSALRSSIRSLAKSDPRRSRRYGKLALLLDDQDDLARLAHMYFCSLIQG